VVSPGKRLPDAPLPERKVNMASSISVEIKAKAALSPMARAIPVLARVIDILPIPGAWKAGLVNACLKRATVSLWVYSGSWRRRATARLSDHLTAEYIPQ